MDLLNYLACCMNLTIELDELNGWILLQRAHMLWAQSCSKASDAFVQGCNLAACILHAVLDAPPVLGRHALFVQYDVAVHRYTRREAEEGTEQQHARHRATQMVAKALQSVLYCTVLGGVCCFPTQRARAHTPDPQAHTPYSQ